MNAGKNRYYFSTIKWLPVLLIGGILAFAVPSSAHHFLLVLGVILALRGADNLIRMNRVANWKKYTAKIKTIQEQFEDVSQTPYTSMKYFYPEIMYEYDIQGEKFSNNRVGFELESIWVPEVGSWGEATPEKNKFWAQWKAGMEVPVFVNPENFNESVLFNAPDKVRRSHYKALILAGMLLALFWAGYVYYNLSK